MGKENEELVFRCGEFEGLLRQDVLGRMCEKQLEIWGLRRAERSRL